MTEETGRDIRLTQKQRATLLYSFEEDSDLWMVLLLLYIESQGEQAEVLRLGIANDTDEWKKMVAGVKNRGFGELHKLAVERIALWNIRIKQLLSEAGHLEILISYLRALISLKNQRVAYVGARADTQRQINSIISSLANNVYVALDKYERATEFVVTGKTSAGEDIPEESRLFYEMMQNEALSHIGSLLAVLLIFKGASCTEDVENLKEFIETVIVAPLETTLSSLMDLEERERLRGRLSGYYKLIRAVEINFD